VKNALPRYRSTYSFSSIVSSERERGALVLPCNARAQFKMIIRDSAKPVAFSLLISATLGE